MSILLPSAARAFRSLLAPGMFSVMIICVCTTIAALIGFVITSGIIVGLAQGSGDTNGIAVAGSMFISAIIAWFLFPGIMPVIVNFFGERIASIIEKKDYPQALPIQNATLWKELLHDAKFSSMTILINILMLPLYLLPVINLFLFYLLNGYLLGREFFVMVARRHQPIPEAENLRKRYSRTIMLAGIMLTVMATIPILNLFAPFWGIALMTHLYHKLKAMPSQG
jgi:CysZ protein